MKHGLSFAITILCAGALHAQTLETLHTWPQPGIVGDPQGPMLVHGTDLVGVSIGGGTNNAGFIFKISDTGVLTKLKDFDISAWTPKGGLILGSDGNYYGASFGGGIASLNGFPGTGNGTVYRLTPAGTLTVRHNFSSANGGTANPVGELVEVSPLVFVGTTQHITSDFGGVVYRLDLSGPQAAYAVVKQLNSFTDGRVRTGVIKASDGKLYGTTDRTIFRVDVDGQNFQELRRTTNATEPTGHGYESGVIEAPDGTICGIASAGGNHGFGVVFRMAKDGSDFTVLHHFDGVNGGGPTGGNVPQPRLLAHSDGNFYGATHSGGASDGGVLFKLTPAGEFTKLRDFGASAPGGLAEKAGNLVVTTSTYNDRGVIYESTTTGALTVRYGFNDALGSKPVGAPLLASDGHLYGTTAEGGANDLGTFWRRTSTGDFEVLASFSSVFARPSSALIEGSDGVLYGTTTGNFSSPNTHVFSATKAGKLTSLQNVNPSEGVVEGNDGALYVSGKGGRLARVSKEGGFTILRNFAGTDGTGGFGPPVLGDDGALYGITNAGGANGSGTFWKYTGAVGGTFTVIRAFAANEKPYGPITKARDGSFHGLLYFNGVANHYRLTANGQFALLGGTTALATDGEPGATGLVERNFGKFYAPYFGPTTTETARRVFEFGGTATPFATLAPSLATSFPVANGPAVGGLARGSDRNLYGVLPDGSGNAGSLYRIVMPASGDPLPAATTLAATEVQSLSATLNGEVTPNGTPAFVYFEYGATTSYGKRTPGQLIQPNATPTASISIAATGLMRNAEFHYRLVAENDAGTVYGGDQSATTTANSAPQGFVDVVPIRAKETLTIPVLANDIDPDGDSFELDSFAQGSSGTVTREGDNLIYKPGKNFAGTDSFAYIIRDSNGATGAGLVQVRNPFLALGGSYAPLINAETGLVALKLSKGGVLTGKFKLGSKAFSIKGSAGLDGSFSQQFIRRGLPNLVVTLTFAEAGGIPIVSGSVAGAPAENFAVPPSAQQYTTVPANGLTGSYTLILDPAPGTTPANLQAPGWATASLKSSGTMTFVGQTPDGKALSFSGKLRRDNSLTIFKSAAGTTFAGSVQFGDAPESDFTGTLAWQRAASAKSIHPGAIDTTFTVQGGKFTPPTKGTRTLAYSASNTAALELENGGLNASITRLFTVDAKDKATLAGGEANPELVKVTLLSRSNGRFEGTFKHPALPKNPVIKFRGVQLQTVNGGTGPNAGIGLFLAPSAAGTVSFTPQ